MPPPVNLQSSSSIGQFFDKFAWLDTPRKPSGILFVRLFYGLCLVG